MTDIQINEYVYDATRCMIVRVTKIGPRRAPYGLYDLQVSSSAGSEWWVSRAWVDRPCDANRRFR